MSGFKLNLPDVANQPVKPFVKPKPKRDVLFGTGATKKAASAAGKKLEKAQLAAMAPKTVNQGLFDFKQDPVNDAVVHAKVVSLPQKAKLDADIEYDHSQLAAIEGIMAEQYSCLIGSAGTGKTTVVKKIVSEIKDLVNTIDLNKTNAKKLREATNGELPPEEEQKKAAAFNLAICFCAFTGRAVQQMKKPLPAEYHPLCNTIHSTLGFYPKYADEMEVAAGEPKMKFVPYFDEYMKLPFDVYIIDEAGMLAIDLWEQLLAAMKPGAKVIFVGDINQLPPVHGRSVLGFAMTDWPTFELTTIHRQAAESPIITAAHSILNGNIPVPVKGQFDMICTDEGSMGTFQLCNKVVKIMHRDGQFDVADDTFIVPQNKDILGQLNFNATLVNYFNAPRTEGGATINPRMMIHTGVETRVFAEGDKVMVLNNDAERGLTNGMTGIIKNIRGNDAYKSSEVAAAEFDAEDLMAEINAMQISGVSDQDDEKEDKNQRQASHICSVDFETGEEIEFMTAGDYNKLTLGYVVTCHKSQGGEYPAVIILCHSANDIMLNREWLYTAVTRGAKHVVLVYNDYGLKKAIRRQRIKGKDLATKIESFNALQDQKDVRTPDLPIARKMKVA